MFRMQKRVAEKIVAKPEETGDPEIKLLRKMLSHLDGNSASDAPSASESEPITDSINEMKGVVAEKRSVTEALLRELGAIEQRLELQSTVTDLNRTYLTAKEKVNQASATVERSRERLAAAQRERESAAANRKDADELVAASQSDVACTAKAVLDLQRLLEQAREMSEQTQTALREREERARELAASEGTAEARVTEAQAALVTDEAQFESARQEALNIKERVDALRGEMVSQGSGGAFAHVQELARQIADLKRPAAD
jgi:chromosome segregation ATPase